VNTCVNDCGNTARLETGLFQECTFGLVLRLAGVVGWGSAWGWEVLPKQKVFFSAENNWAYGAVLGLIMQV
jgi:hypothetical protein